MARQFSMPSQVPPVGMLPPAADAGGRTSAYYTLKNALKAYVVCHINQGNALATVALTLLQAQDVSGTGSKVLGAMPIFLEANTAIADGLIAQAAAAGFTTSAAIADKIVVFEIEPQVCMDIQNGFRTIAIQTGASNAANITEATLFVVRRFQGVSAPSALAN
jgi:hypothetical protein